MSDSSVRLAGRLPDGAQNGLASIAHLLVDDPSAVHVAVVLLDCSRLVTSVDDGSVLPTARLRAIEPIAEGPDAAELRRLLRRAVEKRTGATELPLELERALDELGVHSEAELAAEAATEQGDDPELSSIAEDDPEWCVGCLQKHSKCECGGPALPPGMITPHLGLFREPPAPRASVEDTDRP